MYTHLGEVEEKGTVTRIFRSVNGKLIILGARGSRGYSEYMDVIPCYPDGITPKVGDKIIIHTSVLKGEDVQNGENPLDGWRFATLETETQKEE